MYAFNLSYFLLPGSYACPQDLDLLLILYRLFLEYRLDIGSVRLEFEQYRQLFEPILSLGLHYILILLHPTLILCLKNRWNFHLIKLSLKLGQSLTNYLTSLSIMNLPPLFLFQYKYICFPLYLPLLYLTFNTTINIVILTLDPLRYF